MRTSSQFFRRFLGGCAAGAVLVFGASQASAITIDGNFTDWGISVVDGTSANTTPSNFSAPNPTGATLLTSVAEDSSDLAGDSGYVGPNYGGQNYDVEFAAAARQGNILYMIFVSGQRPDSGFRRYSPGDIFIQASTGTFGIEVGGGIGGGDGSLVQEGDAGSTYALASNGYTKDADGATAGNQLANTAANQTAGALMSNVTWIQDPIAPASDVQIGSGTKIGTVDYAYSRNTITNQHAIIEVAIDTSVYDIFGPDTSILSFHWGPSCGNDVLMGTTAFETAMPEPGSMALLAAGLLGAGFVRRRRGKQA